MVRRIEVVVILLRVGRGVQAAAAQCGLQMRKGSDSEGGERCCGSHRVRAQQRQHLAHHVAAVVLIPPRLVYGALEYLRVNDTGHRSELAAMPSGQGDSYLDYVSAICRGHEEEREVVLGGEFKILSRHLQCQHRRSLQQTRGCAPTTQHAPYIVVDVDLIGYKDDRDVGAVLPARRRRDGQNYGFNSKAYRGTSAPSTSPPSAGTLSFWSRRTPICSSARGSSTTGACG